MRPYPAGKQNRKKYHPEKQPTLKPVLYPAHGGVHMRIRPYKPPISTTAKPFRIVRRLQRTPTYAPIRIGPAMNAAVLAALSATSSMSGLTIGVCMRLVGL